MKTSILYRKILYSADESFSYNRHIPFTLPLHYHDDYELIYIASGSGKEYIRDGLSEYKAGDLMLIGKNIPHFHLSDAFYNTNKASELCDILYFPLSIFPADMNNTKVFFEVNRLLKESCYGVKFLSSPLVKEVCTVMRDIGRYRGVKRVILLYEILDMLSKCNERRVVSSSDFLLTACNNSVHDPINRIYTYLKSNFRESINLKSIASYVGQNPSSLCRFFKQHTGKTLFTVLNEIRIAYACSLLLYSDLNNSQIAYEAGYNNLSYFNKTFKLILHQTPTEYRNNLKLHHDI